MNRIDPIVLIVHPGTLGDVLLAVEALRGVRKTFSSHQVVWVGHSEVGEFLLACEEVDEIIGIEGPFLAQLLARNPRWDGQVKAMLDRCSHCVCWMNDHDGVIEKNLKSMGICSIIQSPQSPELVNFHHEERFIRTLRPWGIMAEVQKKKMALSKNVSIPFTSEPYFVIHPGSGSKHKCLDTGLLGTVARRILEQSGMKVVVLGGPADQCQIKSFLDEIPGGKSYLFNNHPLTAVAGILKGAIFFIGHDSGISHLSAGLGVPSIVLFGPTNSAYWAPRGDHVTVIQGPSCQCAEWKQVQQCFQKPCLKFSVDVILEKAELLVSYLPFRRKSQVSDLKSQMYKNKREPEIQTLEA